MDEFFFLMFSKLRKVLKFLTGNFSPTPPSKRVPALPLLEKHHTLKGWRGHVGGEDGVEMQGGLEEAAAASLGNFSIHEARGEYCP